MSELVMKMMNRNGEWRQRTRRRWRNRRLLEWIAQEDIFSSSLAFHIMNEWMNEAREWMEGINKLLSLMMDIQRFRMLASECKLSSKLLCIWNEIFELRTWWLNGYELFRAFQLFLSSLPVLKSWNKNKNKNRRSLSFWSSRDIKTANLKPFKLCWNMIYFFIRSRRNAKCAEKINCFWLDLLAIFCLCLTYSRCFGYGQELSDYFALSDKNHLFGLQRATHDFMRLRLSSREHKMASTVQSKAFFCAADDATSWFAKLSVDGRNFFCLCLHSKISNATSRILLAVAYKPMLRRCE